MDPRSVILITTALFTLLIIGLSLAMFFGHWGFFKRYEPKVPENGFLMSSVFKTDKQLANSVYRKFDFTYDNQIESELK